MTSANDFTLSKGAPEEFATQGQSRLFHAPFDCALPVFGIIAVCIPVDIIRFMDIEVK